MAKSLLLKVIFLFNINFLIVNDFGEKINKAFHKSTFSNGSRYETIEYTFGINLIDTLF